MAFCNQCGTQIGNQDTVCPNCGAQIMGNGNPQYQQPYNQQPYNPQQYNPQQYNGQAPAENDNGGFLWGLLGCCIPIVGLVLFLVWKDTKPKTAKAAGIGALISVCIAFIYYILIAVLGVGAGIASGLL